jgi:hypothetical protein
VTLVSYVPARKKDVILSSQHHDDTCMGEEKDHNPKVITHYNATQVGLIDILDKLVREYTCTRSTSSRNMELFLSLIAATCISAFILWMLKS